MDDQTGDASVGRPDLAVLFAELQQAVLDGPEVTEFLDRICDLAARVVPGTDCSIVVRHGTEVVSSARAGAVAPNRQELLFLSGRGPCRETLRTSRRIEIPAMADEGRWNGYGDQAVARGVNSSVSLPVVVEGGGVGALTLFAATVGAFPGPVAARAQVFADQVGAALTILLRQEKSATLDRQMHDALATRAVIDQAMGILMYTLRISARDAFDMLRRASEMSNRRTSAIAADLVLSMTGHPAEHPRPLSRRG